MLYIHEKKNSKAKEIIEGSNFINSCIIRIFIFFLFLLFLGTWPTYILNYLKYVIVILSNIKQIVRELIVATASLNYGATRRINSGRASS